MTPERESAKPIPLKRVIAVLEIEAKLEKEARRYWRAKLFEQAAALLRKQLPV